MQVLLSTVALQFYVIAVFGMVCHAIIRWGNGEIVGNAVDWFVVNPRRSVASLMCVLGGVATLLSTGTLADANQGAHIIAAFGVGYTFDSGVNKQ